MITTFIILILSAVFFINGKIRSDLVALCALVALVVFNILTPSEALSGFSNSVVIMMIGLFVVGGGILQTGLAKMISNRILKMAGTSENKLFLLVMLLTAFIGAFVSNTGTVALMLPVVVSMAVSANLSPSRFLMPLAFASSMGGMLTLIGTPPNLVIQEILAETDYGKLSFFSFTPVGLICIAVGVVLLLPLSKWFLSKKDEEKENNHGNKSAKELAREYQLAKNLYRILVNNSSLIDTKMLIDLDLTKKYNITILEIRHKKTQNKFFKSIEYEPVNANTVINKGDMLYVMGAFSNIQQFVDNEKLELVPSKFTETETSELGFMDIGIAEVLLMPNSSFINKEVKDSKLREKFSINILGIQRKNEFILHNVKDEKMRIGDALLIQGTWENIALLKNDQSDLVVVGEPLEEAAKIPQTKKAPIAALIMLAMVAAMTFDLLPAVICVMIAAMLMVFTGCIRSVEEAYKTINWQSIVLIGGMLPMSIALEKTGASELISSGLVDTFGSYGPRVLLAGVYLATSALTMFISNTATAVLLAPIALSAAVGIGVHPMPFMFAVTVAASMCFSSPFSTPPNALVMSAGRYTFMDYIKVGLPLQIVLGIIMIVVLPLLFPF